MRYSVIVPTHNAQTTIAATLQSVLSQTHPDFEVIVVDDFSQDATREIIEDFRKNDARVTLIALNYNSGGPAHPRNVGVEAAKHEWIAFLDADDIWHPEKLELQSRVLQQTEARFCSTQMIDFSDDASLNFTTPSELKLASIGFMAQLVKPQTPTSSVVMRRDLARIHTFNESPLYRAREDFDCWLHCHESIGRSVKILHPLVGYRKSSAQISANKLTMVRRHYHVLKNYRLQSGRRLGWAAAVLPTITHFTASLYTRIVLERL